jgi:hypothetical protein
MVDTVSVFRFKQFKDSDLSDCLTLKTKTLRHGIITHKTCISAKQLWEPRISHGRSNTLYSFTLIQETSRDLTSVYCRVKVLNLWSVRPNNCRSDKHRARLDNRASGFSRKLYAVFSHLQIPMITFNLSTCIFCVLATISHLGLWFMC